MSDTPVDDDHLDGCLADLDIDWDVEGDDDETSELRALFPDGDPSAEIEWRALFREEDVDDLDRRFAAITVEEQIRSYAYGGSGRDTGIANRLRAAGLRVVEISGWQTRGSSTFNPKGSVDHHTASAKGSNAPSLNICINGRTDLPGPLCQVLIARDNTCYVIAAGRANHAGTGGYWGITGNSNVYGVEHENTGTGTEPWREDQFVTAAKVHAALLLGIAPQYRRSCHHKEWTSRKIDKWGQTGADLRGRVAAALSVPAPTPTGDDDMPNLVIRGDQTPHWWFTDGMTKRYIGTSEEAAQHAYAGLARWNAEAGGGPFVVPQNMVNNLPTAPADGHPGHAGVAHIVREYVLDIVRKDGISGAVDAAGREAQRTIDTLGWTLSQIKGTTDSLQPNIEAALAGLVTNIVEALPAGSGGGLSSEELRAAVERGVTEGLNTSGLLGLLPGK